MDKQAPTKKPSMVSEEELVKIMAENNLQGSRRGNDITQATKLINAYLFKNEPEFIRVMEFRDRGWNTNKEKGDAFFKMQRERADQTDEAGEKRFYNMMVQIADEMHALTGALDPPACHERPIKVLDICMAPGGYTAAILKHHPDSQAFAITLPSEKGGHTIHLPKAKLAGLQLLDVTMLAAEFANKVIPAKHPARGEFLTVRPFKFYKFDLIFCDGMVLRTQERPTYREENEVTRLACSQLILAMQRIIPGGTIIMLLHKIDSVGAGFILYTFSKFAKVEVFKPTRKHGTRSSFYMIAKDVQPEEEAAMVAVRQWKDSWWNATFGGEDSTGERKVEESEEEVLNLLQNYGERLIEMGRPIWRIQSDALNRTEYAGDGSAAIHPAIDSNGPPTPKTPTFKRPRASWGKASLQENTLIPTNFSPMSPKSPDWRSNSGSF